MRYRRLAERRQVHALQCAHPGRIQAENYPFCTIDPNVGIVEVPDPRMDALAIIVKPERIVPTTIEFVDIAGLVAGAAQARAGQQVSVAHPRGGRDCARGALLRG